MARHKNSPALFEVIRNAQQKQREQLERQRQIEQNGIDVSPAAALLRSPLYWFKGKHAHDAVHGIANRAPAEPVMREVSPSLSPHDDVIPTTVYAEPIEVPTAVAVPVAVPQISTVAAEYTRQIREEIAAQESPAAEPFFDQQAPQTQRDPAVALSSESSIDADDYLSAAPQQPNQIELRFSYTTAALAGVGILVALAVVYVVGAAGHSRANALAANTVHPDVLNVTPVTPGPDGNLLQQNNTDDNQSLGRTDATGTSQSLGLDTLGKPIPVPTSVKRVIGLQYVVLLSFPRADDAKELVQFLADNGVPASAEKALPGYSPSWYSVVTTRGFDHVHGNTDYDSYVASLGKLMQKYAHGSKFKTFQPDVYKWRGN